MRQSNNKHRLNLRVWSHHKSTYGFWRSKKKTTTTSTFRILMRVSFVGQFKPFFRKAKRTEAQQHFFRSIALNEKENLSKRIHLCKAFVKCSNDVQLMNHSRTNFRLYIAIFTLFFSLNRSFSILSVSFLSVATDVLCFWICAWP